MSDAFSPVKSKVRYNAFDSNRDDRLVIKLNALIHTDFYKLILRRKIRIETSASRLGMMIIFG